MAVTYQVVITPDAQVCIREIIDYVLDNASVEAANKVSRAINDKIQSLKTFPERHDIVPDISKRSLTYRRVMAMSYRIVYTVQKDEVRVIVVDVDRGSRDPKRLVKKLG